MNKTILIAIVFVALGGGALFVSNSLEKDKDTMMSEKDEMMNDGVMSKEEGNNMDDKMEKSEMAKVGLYEEFAPEKLMRAETGDVVLFFNASWCPSCRGLNADIESNLNSIPPVVSILKVDYDKEIELKKKYGITYQHTLVQVDKDGNLIKKWSGSPSLARLLAEIE
jgi:thiol-disulfide isomerase/thioredoxin